jgi:hypothetical protein
MQTEKKLNTYAICLPFGKQNKRDLFSTFSINSSLFQKPLNTLNAEINTICHLLALLGAHHILHVSRIRVKGPSFMKTVTGK